MLREDELGKAFPPFPPACRPLICEGCPVQRPQQFDCIHPITTLGSSSLIEEGGVYEAAFPGPRVANERVLRAMKLQVSARLPETHSRFPDPS